MNVRFLLLSQVHNRTTWIWATRDADEMGLHTVDEVSQFVKAFNALFPKDGDDGTWHLLWFAVTGSDD